MSASTLELTFGDYLSEVGNFLGWGRGADKGDRDWGPRKTAQLTDMVKSGLRKAYWPAVPPPQLTYDWSFLKILHRMTMADGVNEAPLPEDFGGFENMTVFVANEAGGTSCPIRVYDISQLEHKANRSPDTTGSPQMVALVQGRVSRNHSGRSSLRVWPIPEQDYTLKFVYHVLPDALTESHPYHYGGAVHAEMFLEACLAVAEVRLDNIPNGPHEMAFQRELMKSVGQDRKRKAQTFGLNLDRSDSYRDDRHDRDYPGYTVTVDGTAY